MTFFGLDYFVTSHQRIYLPYLVSALVIAYIYVRLYPHQRHKLFSKQIWWHDSARLDYQYFVLVSLIKAFVIMPLILSSKEVSLWLTLSLQNSLGYMEAVTLSKSSVVLFYTLTLFVVGDLTRYWLHRLLHTMPALWEIHKVHHSAEVLNPLTFYRVHPLENVLFGLRYALSAGIVTGVFIYLVGARIGLVQIMGANLFVFLFGMAGANLRHSHIPVRYGNLLEHLFISPYQHQVHHSMELSHKNFGGVLAVWDWIFNTLHIEKVRELEFGLKNRVRHDTLAGMLLSPFAEISKQWDIRLVKSASGVIK